MHSPSSAIDAIIAEAKDLCALEEIAALNTAHLAFDSAVLPSHLESRFHALKSFPAPALNRRRGNLASSLSFDTRRESSYLSRFSAENSQKDEIFGVGSCQLDPKQENLAPSPRRGSSHLSQFPAENSQKDEIFGVGSPRLDSKSDLDGEKDEELGARELNMASKFHLGSSPSSSAVSWGELSVSPPKQRSCFGCFQARRKVKNDEDVLSEFGVSALRREQRKLKKALKEQEKLNREAEKMVKWVKQVSSRMNVEMIEEEMLSDVDEEFK